MKYADMNFKIPRESENYKKDSKLVVDRILKILDERKAKNDNKIIINTNLRLGLPLENINKIKDIWLKHGLMKSLKILEII